MTSWTMGSVSTGQKIVLRRLIPCRAAGAGDGKAGGKAVPAKEISPCCLVRWSRPASHINKPARIDWKTSACVTRVFQSSQLAHLAYDASIKALATSSRLPSTPRTQKHHFARPLYLQAMTEHKHDIPMPDLERSPTLLASPTISSRVDSSWAIPSARYVLDIQRRPTPPSLELARQPSLSAVSEAETVKAWAPFTREPPRVSSSITWKAPFWHFPYPPPGVD